MKKPLIALTIALAAAGLTACNDHPAPSTNGSGATQEQAPPAAPGGAPMAPGGSTTPPPAGQPHNGSGS